MGFYKLDNGQLFHAENSVRSRDYELIAGNKYDLPIDGWYWFDSQEQAYEFFNYIPDIQ